MPDEPRGDHAPDLDLLEYVLVSARDAGALSAVATAVARLVETGSIRLLDAVVLVRDAGSPRVASAPPAEHGLVQLAAVAEGGVLLSRHDVELASVTLAPCETALLLLVEDRWAGALSDAAREGGARLSGGERIARDRVQASLEGAGGTDLIRHGPGASPMIDQAGQVRKLAHLVERGILSLDRYDAQRRRVLDGC